MTLSHQQKAAIKAAITDHQAAEAVIAILESSDAQPASTITVEAVPAADVVAADLQTAFAALAARVKAIEP